MKHTGSGLETDWKWTGSGLEVEWKRTGSGLERTGSGLEADWKGTGSRLEPHLNIIQNLYVAFLRGYCKSLKALL